MTFDHTIMRFHNPKGYNRVFDHHESYLGWMWWRKVTVDEFTIDPVAPITLEVGPRCFLQPDRHGFVNDGNIPPWLQIIPGLQQDRFPLSYLFHDLLCEHKGGYFSSTLGGVFTFCEMQSKSVHKLLGCTVRMEGGNCIEACAIHSAVRLFGPRW